MRRLLTGLLTITAALSCAAKVTVLPQLPQGELPDCEVVTNVALTANLANLEALRFTLDFEPSASNELAVAVGADADGDGDLSLEEAAVVFGCDCGGWYRVDAATGGVTAGGLGETLEIGKGDFGDGWDTVKILHRGLGVFAETVTQDAERRKLIIRFR
jgi:hypothetical protein